MTVVYIAGYIDERAEWAFREARQANLSIAWDWYEASRTEGKLDTHGKRYAVASKDLSALRTADVLWLLAPRDRGAGCWVEFGAALALDIPLVTSGAWQRNVFGSMGLEFDTDAEALDSLVTGRFYKPSNFPTQFK